MNALLLAALLLPVSARAEESAAEQLARASGKVQLGTVASVRGRPVSDAPAAAPSLPAEFQIRERVIAWSDTFDLQAEGDSYGTVAQRILSLTKEFSYNDARGACVARARARLLSWGTHVDVTDCSGRAIGSVKEQVFRSLLRVRTLYSVLDPSGREIATSEKIEWLAASFTLRRPDNRVVATLRRDWPSILRDIWRVRVSDPSAVDSRLLVMLAAYKTSVDNDRAAEERKSSSSSN